MRLFPGAAKGLPVGKSISSASHGQAHGIPRTLLRGANSGLCHVCICSAPVPDDLCLNLVGAESFEMEAISNLDAFFTRVYR